jgi:hypothetical protein
VSRGSKRSLGGSPGKQRNSNARGRYYGSQARRFGCLSRNCLRGSSGSPAALPRIRSGIGGCVYR